MGGPSKYPRWKEDDYRQVFKMQRHGKKSREIAEAFGVPIYIVYGRMATYRQGKAMFAEQDVAAIDEAKGTVEQDPFENPIATYNYETGESACRIWEYWAQGCNVHKSHAGSGVSRGKIRKTAEVGI